MNTMWIIVIMTFLNLFSLEVPVSRENISRSTVTGSQTSSLAVGKYVNPRTGEVRAVKLKVMETFNGKLKVTHLYRPPLYYGGEGYWEKVNGYVQKCVYDMMNPESLENQFMYKSFIASLQVYVYFDF